MCDTYHTKCAISIVLSLRAEPHRKQMCDTYHTKCTISIVPNLIYIDKDFQN